MALPPLATTLPEGAVADRIARGSGHYVQNDEPSLVVDAVRWIVGAP